MSDFLHPERLWLLVGVLALAVSYVAVLRWRRAVSVRFTEVALLDRVAPRRPHWRRHVVAGLQLLGLTAGVVAVARPVTTTTERTESEGRIILALDVSLSMQSTDVAPNRLAAAQQAATDFIARVADDVEVGLVSFSGTVAVEVPPTLDRAALTSAIAGLELDDATAIGDALVASTDLLVQLQAPKDEDADVEADEALAPGAIVLLSDGERTVGASAQQGAAAAAVAEVPVFTIAFGTPEGTITEIDGDVIAVPVKPEQLREIADTTGGRAYEAASETELADVYSRIDEVLGETLGEEVEVVTERTWVWAAGSLAALATAWALALWWLRGMV